MDGIPIYSAVEPRDIAIEACIALGARWSVRGVDVPPIAAGHLVCLDLAASPMLPRSLEAQITEPDTAQALGFLLCGRASAQILFDELHGDDSAILGLMDGARRTMKGADWRDVARTICASMQHALGGFQCVHWESKGTPAAVVRFDASWLGQLIGDVTQSAPALTPDDVTWGIPLAMASHLKAATNGRQGAKIHRKRDIGRAIEWAQRKEREALV